jgi:hypothetical protein
VSDIRFWGKYVIRYADVDSFFSRTCWDLKPHGYRLTHSISIGTSEVFRGLFSDCGGVRVSVHSGSSWLQIFVIKFSFVQGSAVVN